MIKKFAQALEFNGQAVYYPEIRPGYTAWASLFKFDNGDLGIAFNEIRQGGNPNFTPVPLEFAEAMVLQYRELPDVLPACNPDLISEYVYLKSTDNGQTWQETGRCPVNTRHYWHVGFPDGRIVRIIGTQQYRYELGDDRFCNVIEESKDGGNTWKEIARFMEGKFFYGHKFKKLSNGNIVAVGPVLPSFGLGGEIQTRPGELPGHIKPDQTAFLISEDGGYTWDGPHYIFSGIEAWEPDFVELPDGSLLFINSTVQPGRAVRQIVRKCSTGWINEPLMEIHRGAPDDWGNNPQGGFTPETVTITPQGLIVGARRGGGYSCSNDLGENWYEIEGLPKCEYQPMIECLPDGKFLAVWHYGLDSRFGEFDMYIGTHEFAVKANLSKPTALTLQREFSADGNQYINAFNARLTADGKPLKGRKINMHVKDTWFPSPDDRNNPIDVWDSQDIRTSITDSNGVARFELKDKACVPDRNMDYTVAVSFTSKQSDEHLSCKGPTCRAYPLTAARDNVAPYPVYNSRGMIMITPETANDFPDLADIVEHFCIHEPSADIEKWIDAAGSKKRAKEVLQFLLDNNIISVDDKDIYHWYRARQSGDMGKPFIHGVKICNLKEYCN